MQRNEIVPSRRWSIATLVVLAIVFSSGWGADHDDSDRFTSSPGSLAASDSSEALGRLDFLGFEGDDILDLTDDFRQRTGLDLRSSYVNSEAEAEAQILSGAAGGVDVISFTSTASPGLQASGVLQPIDRSSIPNLEIMLPYFEEIAPEVFTDDAGELVCIPAYWGAIGVVFNSTVVESVAAFADLLDPAWTGRLTTLDVPNPIFYVAAVANDIDLSRMNEDDLDTLVDWLAPYMEQVRTFSPTFGDIITLLASGEVDAVMPGFDFIVNGAAASGNDDIRIEIDLAEGVPILVSCQGIASTADNLGAAHAWLNNLLAPDVAAATAELQGGIATVEPAIDMIDADLRARYPYDDLGGYLQSSDIITDWPVSSDEFVDADDVAAAWAALKAGSQS